jgi:hypothetical protein
LIRFESKIAKDLNKTENRIKKKKRKSEKRKKGRGLTFGPAAEAASAQYHLNPKGYPPSSMLVFTPFA